MGVPLFFRVQIFTISTFHFLFYIHCAIFVIQHSDLQMIFSLSLSHILSQFCANIQPNLGRQAPPAKTLWSNEAAGQAGVKNLRSKFLGGQFGVLRVKALPKNGPWPTFQPKC